MKTVKIILPIIISVFLSLIIQNSAFAGWYNGGGVISRGSPGEGTYYYYCDSNGNGMSYIDSQAVGPSGTASCYWWDSSNPTCGTWDPSVTLWRSTPQVFVMSGSTDTPSGINIGGGTCTVTTNGGTCGITISDKSGNTTVCTSPAAKIDIINPTGYIIATGTKGDYNGHSGVTISSTGYTRVPNISLTVSGSDLGSGLSTYLIKCNGNTIISGSGTPASNYNLDLDSQAGCSGEGTKTFSLELTDMVGNSFSGSQSIIYDKTLPTYNAENLLIHATNSYQYTTESPLDSTSGIKDYSITWEESGKSDIDFFNSSTGTFVFSGTNAPYSLGGNGSITSTLKITVEDYAGNATYKTIQIKRIADDISVGNSIFQSIIGGATPYPVGDNYENRGINITANDRYGNPIFPVDGIRSTTAEWNIDNHASFLSSSNFSDGAVYYSWDGNSPVSNQIGNTETITYNTFAGKNSNIYSVLIKSLVPTRNAGHPYNTNNYIKFASSNALIISNNDICSGGYNSGFRCSGQNTNFTQGISDGVMDNKIDGTATALKDKEFSFGPAIMISPSREWTVMSDNTWSELNLEIQNKSTHNNFNLDKIGLDFIFGNNDAAFFADGQITSNNTSNPDFVGPSSTKVANIIVPSDNRLIFDIVPNTPINLMPSSNINKKVLFKGNSYGIGFGKTGFETYIPHWISYNYIGNLLYSTSYNAGKIDIGASGESLGNKITVKGSIGDSGKNQIKNTTEGGSSISVDTSNLYKYTYKTNIKQNVFKLTNGLPKNNTNCNPEVYSLNGEIIYYDFTGKSNSTGIDGNKGCVVKLSGASGLLGVNGMHTIIVNGGNLYIDTDMYYTNESTSLLGMIVLRDNSNKINGGNIYINPSVTNIVGSAFAEGSLISWDGTKVFSMGNTNEGELTKQLLWYGSVYSANTIGGSLNPTKSECIFGTDYYMQNNNKNCSQEESSKYDYALLRRFTLIQGGSTCPGGEAPKKSGTTNEKNAWAGKRECYISDPGAPNLRTSTKKSALIMEFNPSSLIGKLKGFGN